MKSLYAMLRERCGLSIREAAAFHDVPVNTVTKWSSGARTAPPGVIAELRSLYETIEDVADRAVAGIDEAKEAQGSPPETIELGLASDDYEAQQLGLPSAGAHAAAVGLVAISIDDPVVIVPCGATAATAAAADVNDGVRRKS